MSETRAKTLLNRVSAWRHQQFSSNHASTWQRPLISWLTGLTTGAIVAQFVAVWSIVCGVSVPSLVALSLAASAGCIVAGYLWNGVGRLDTAPDNNSHRNRMKPTFRSGIVGSLTVACTLLAICWLLPGCLDGMLVVGTQLSSTNTDVAFAVPAALALIFTVLLVRWLMSIRSQIAAMESTSAASENVYWRMLCIGCAAGVVFQIVNTAFLFPSALPASILLLATSIAAAVRATTGRTATGRAVGHQAVNHCSPASSGAALGSAVASLPNGLRPHWLTVCSMLGIGLLVQVTLRITSGLMPLNFVVIGLAASGCLVMSCLTSIAFMQRLLKSRPALWLLPLLAASLPWLASQLIPFHLQINANGFHSWVILMASALQITGLMMVPLCLIQQRWATRSHNTSFLFVCAAVLTGGAMGWLLLDASITPVMITAFVAVMLPLVVSHSGSTQTSPESEQLPLAGPAFRWTWGGVFAAGLSIAALAEFDFAASTQLLFSERSLQGYRLGLSPELITHSSSGRLLLEEDSRSGRLSVWKAGGDQIEFRRSEFVSGRATTNAFTTPQPIAESLTAVLPLVLHSAPGSVKILGDDSGTVLRVCCGFPLHTIAAVRADKASTEVAKQFVWHDMAETPLNDSRVRISFEPVATNIRRRDDAATWDVVIADTPSPSVASSHEQLSVEFYQRIFQQLGEDGVLCQRIVQQQLGAQPLLQIFSTVAEVFPRTIIVRLAPGEVALLAGKRPDSLLDQATLNRLMRTHVSRELARCGWDWSQVAALPVVDSGDPIGIFDHESRQPAASCGDLIFSVLLPVDSVRAANKTAELGQTFAPHQQRLADAAPRGSGYPEFARRYSAVIQQMEILASFPDDPWPYRRSLKMEMQRNPRPAIEEIQHGEVRQKAHPLDEYRKNYFVTLGESLQQAADGYVAPAQLRKLTQFANLNYEPLITHFVHHELVRIHEVTEHPSPALEFRHRLHTVYYTENNDRSVRQVVDALSQLLNDPELLANEELRFDHVNSMLQELVQRWEARQGYDPPSARRTQLDVDNCVAVASQALDALQNWSASVGYTSDDIRLRRRFINDALISPLRDYREHVLAHRIKTESPLAAPDESASASDLPLLLSPSDLSTN